MNIIEHYSRVSWSEHTNSWVDHSLTPSSSSSSSSFWSTHESDHWWSLGQHHCLGLRSQLWWIYWWHSASIPCWKSGFQFYFAEKWSNSKCFKCSQLFGQLAFDWDAPVEGLFEKSSKSFIEIFHWRNLNKKCCWQWSFLEFIFDIKHWFRNSLVLSLNHSLWKAEKFNFNQSVKAHKAVSWW